MSITFSTQKGGCSNLTKVQYFTTIFTATKQLLFSFSSYLQLTLRSVRQGDQDKRLNSEKDHLNFYCFLEETITLILDGRFI